MRLNRRIIFAVFLTAANTAFTLQAQQAAPAPLKWGSVNVQGSYRTRLEAWDWFEGQGDPSYAFSGNILRLSFSQQRKAFEWQLELAAPFLLGLPENAAAPGAQGLMGVGANYFAGNKRERNAGMVFPKQANIRLKNLFGDETQSLRLGRFEFSDGAEITPKDASLAAVKRDRVAQRLIGPFGWTHVGRSFDGFHYVANRSTNVTLLGAFPTRGVFQVDGWGFLDVGFLYASLNRGFQRKTQSGDWRVFGIYYHDWRRVVKTDNRPQAARQADMGSIRVGSFGGHYLHAARTSGGTFDAMLWGLVQTGKWGRLDHRGWAYALEGGWQPPGLPKLRPWLRAGYSHTNGDSNPNDNKHETFFQILPTPRPFARFPFFDMVNNEDLFGSLAVRPHKAVTVKSEIHGLRLSSRNDLWFLGGGAFQPWTFGYIGRPSNGGKGLATLSDVSIDWNMRSNVTLSGYYGYANGKSVIRAIYPNGKNGSFGYIEMLYRF